MKTQLVNMVQPLGRLRGPTVTIISSVSILVSTSEEDDDEDGDDFEE